MVHPALAHPPDDLFGIWWRVPAQCAAIPGVIDLMCDQRQAELLVEKGCEREGAAAASAEADDEGMILHIAKSVGRVRCCGGGGATTAVMLPSEAAW